MDSEEVRRRWAERSGEYSPAYYAHHGPDERSEAIRSRIGRFLDRDASILELGCSSGRHLAHLREHGFEDLAGIDVNEDAFDVMADAYPDLAASGTFYHDTIEDVVVDLEDGRFDVVFSVETLQHLHPDAEWVLEDLRRITGDLLITVENEGEASGVTDEAAQSVDESGVDEVAGNEADDDPTRSTNPGVNYVNDDLPLYYRDWNRVFTDLGFVQVDARSGKRDTVRTFRAPGT